jgi:hypothetical protein
VVAIVIAGTLLILYWSTLSHHYSGDGILYAAAVEAIRAGRYGSVNLSVFLHAHHMLYNPTGLLFHGLWSETTPAVVTLALANGLTSALVVALFFLLAHRCGLAMVPAGLSALTIGLSYGFWFFAVNAEAYPLAQLGVMSFVLALLGPAGGHGRPRGGSGEFRWGAVVWISATWVLAVLGHIVNVMLVVPLLVCCVARRSARAAVLIIAIAGGVTLAVYLLASWLCIGSASPSHLVRFLSPGYLVGDYLEANPFAGGVKTIRAALFGFGPSLAGLPLRPWLALAGVAVVALVVGGRGGGAVPPTGKVTSVLVSWPVAFLALFSVWDAGNLEFALWLMPPAVLGLAAAVDRVGETRARGLILGLWLGIVLMMTVGSYREAIAPATRIETNRYLETTQWLGEQLGEEDLLLLSGVPAVAQYKFYLPYFANRRTYWVEQRSRVLGEESWRSELERLREAVGERQTRVFQLVAMGVPVAPLRSLSSEFRFRAQHRSGAGEVVELLEWQPAERGGPP